MSTKRSALRAEDRPSIQIRHFTLPKNSGTPRYWMDEDPATTHFLHALSCIFPGGERFFVKSVLAYQNDIDDPRLKRDARLFCGQESVHGQQHEAFNARADEFDLKLQEITRAEESRIMRRLSLFSKRRQLATTVALEHMTAIMGHALLKSPDLMQLMHPHVRPLWIWHAIEEIEHKAVAHEIYYSVGGHDRERYWALIVGSLGLMTASLKITVQLMKHDGMLFNWKSYLRLMSNLHRTGFLGHVWVGYKDYFRSDFHPWQTDDRQLLEQFVAEINQYVPQRNSKTGPVAG